MYAMNRQVKQCTYDCKFFSERERERGSEREGGGRERRERGRVEDEMRRNKEVLLSCCYITGNEENCLQNVVGGEREEGR